jgi:hypothetical protein
LLSAALPAGFGRRLSRQARGASLAQTASDPGPGCGSDILHLLLGLFVHHHRQDYGGQAGEGEGPDQTAACPFFELQIRVRASDIGIRIERVRELFPLVVRSAPAAPCRTIQRPRFYHFSPPLGGARMGLGGGRQSIRHAAQGAFGMNGGQRFGRGTARHIQRPANSQTSTLPLSGASAPAISLSASMPTTAWFSSKKPMRDEIFGQHLDGLRVVATSSTMAGLPGKPGSARADRFRSGRDGSPACVTGSVAFSASSAASAAAAL